MMSNAIPSHTGLYKAIRDIYDSRIVSAVRQYVRSSEKIAAKKHLNFNTRAKRYGLIPKSLRIRSLVHTQEGRNIAARASKIFFIGPYI